MPVGLLLSTLEMQARGRKFWDQYDDSLARIIHDLSVGKKYAK